MKLHATNPTAASGLEVGQAASLPAAPAGAKSAAKAIPAVGRLAACLTLAGSWRACSLRLFRTWAARLLGVAASAGLAWAQDTAFSYQGQLTDGAAAANGTYDLTFSLWNAATDGAQQGATLTQTGVGVTNGLFTATLDFGAQFTGAGRWLEIAVRTNGAAAFTTLAERQPVLPTPYAIHAATAGTATTATTVTGNVLASQLTGTLSATQIPNLDASKITGGTFTGNGSGLTNVSVDSLVQILNPVSAWGLGSSGELKPPADLDNVIALDGGFNHSLALRLDGTVVAWGQGPLAVVPVGLSGVKAIAASVYHCLAVKADGKVEAWGDVAEGRLAVPADLVNVISVDAGYGHNLALKSDGTVVAWGRSVDGQTAVPAELSGVVAVAAGFGHSLALKSDGTVVGWGSNVVGASSVPSSLTGVVAVAAGYYHNLALKSDGTVVAWGLNSNGQATVPSGLSEVIAIAAGNGHSLALKADGTVVAWGWDEYGQVSLAAQLRKISILAAGVFHGLAFCADVTSPAPIARLDGNNVFRGRVSADEFSGNGSELTSLNASALTTGTVPAAQIPDLDAGKVTTGTFATARIPTLTPGQIPSLDASKIATGTFTGNGSGLTSLNASALSSGTVPVARVPDLDAAKITSGSLAAARIPSLDASKVTTGTFTAAQIPNLDAAKISSGTFTGNGSGLVSLNASALSSGTVPVARIPDLDAGKITTGTLNDARLSGNVALENGSPAFTAAAGIRAASFTGTRTGDFNAAVVHVENTQTGSTAAPALRVVARGGDAEGALSVTANAGPIARFGNFTTWVAKLDNSGNFSATSFITLSDRNQKTGFTPVDVEAVLAKVATLPLTTWHYTNDVAATPHLGPMAQDFHAAFGLGGDDKTITTVDADGVALAAIQGLHHRTESLAAENAVIREELARQQTANADLRDELGELRLLVRQLQQQLNANRP